MRASAQVQAQALRAEVASWREEAGLADQKARQQDELAKVVGAQAELHALELKDEIAFFKDRYKELALIFAHGEPHQQGRASLGGARGGGARGGARRESLGHGLGEVAGGVGHVVGSFVGGISSAFKESFHQGDAGRKPAQPGPPRRASQPWVFGDASAAPAPPPPRPATAPPPLRDGEILDPVGGGGGGGSSGGGGGSPGRGGGGGEPSPALRFGHGRATKEAYAEWLGLHARTHAELMWVAEEAVLASRELPSGWQTRADPQGRPYYLHEASGSSLREHPRDAEFKQLVGQLKLEQLHASRAAQTTQGTRSTRTLSTWP